MQLRGWYAGAVTLMLAPAALLVRPTATRIAVAVYALFCVIMVVGIPPVFDLFEQLPGFSSTHQQPMIAFFVLCLGLLAGWGLDELSGRRAELPRERLVLAVAVGVFCLPLVWMVGSGRLTATGVRTALEVAWGFSDPPVSTSGESPAADVVRMSALLQWLPLAGLGLLLIVLRLRGRGSLRLSATVFIAATLALLAVDLFRANMGFNPAITKEEAVMPETGAIRYLQSRTPSRFAGLGLGAFEPLPADLTMTFGLYDARGYDYPTEGRYDTLWRRSVNNVPHDRPADRARRRHAGLDSGAEPAERDRPHRQPGRTAAATPGTGGRLPRPRRRGLSQLERAAACVRRRAPAHRRQRTRGARRRHRSRFRRPPRRRDRARAARAAPGRRWTGERCLAQRAWSPTSPSEWSPGRRPRAPACSSSQTCITPAGRRRWTGARCPSSESTTCCAACRCRPAPMRSSSATSRPASAPAGSSARSAPWRSSSPFWWAGAAAPARIGRAGPAS